MTGEAVVRCLPVPMAVDAETHGVIDRTLGHGAPRDVTVTRRAVDAGTEVRRMVEADVRFLRKSVDPLPREVDTLLLDLRELLDERPVGGDCIVTDHAGLDAWKTGDWTLRHRLVTVLSALQSLFDVSVVRERKRLLDAGPHAEEVSHRLAERPMSRSEHQGCSRGWLRISGTGRGPDFADQCICKRRGGRDEQQRDKPRATVHHPPP